MKTLKILGKSLSDNKKDTLLSVLFVTLEVICECALPFVMARLIDSSGVDVNIIYCFYHKRIKNQHHTFHPRIVQHQYL